jgi:hypothetical protein
MTTPITGFPSDTAVNAGNTLAGWFGNLIEKTNNKLAPLYQPPVKTEEDLADEEYWRQYWAAQDREKARREAKGAEGSKPISPSPYSNTPFGVVLDARDALSNLFNPKPSVTQQNSNAPIAQVKDRSTGDLAPSVNRPETSFDPTRLQQGESSVNQGASSELNLPELLQSEPYQEPVQNEQQPQVKQEDPLQTQLNSYLNSLVANSKLQGQVTQEQLAQLRGEQARLAEIRSPEHRKMNPIDWVNLGIRNILAPLTLNPTMTTEQYKDRKYAADVGQTKEQIDEARGRASAMAKAVEQQQAGINQGLKGLSGFQGMQQEAELYPLVKRLQEARVASTEQAPELAQDNAATMAAYRAAQVDKLRGDLAVALQKAATLQYNREHPDNPIPLSGNNKAPVFDIVGALNMLMGGEGVSQGQGQAPTKQDTTDDFVTE